jgi:hypothetical protein
VLGAAGMRKATDSMGRACVEGDEERGRTLQGATMLAKHGKGREIIIIIIISSSSSSSSW